MVLSFLMCMLTILGCRENKEVKLENPKAKLGHLLFFEKKISFNHTKSCASCHSPEMAFTDGYRRSIAANGENAMHNAPSILNLNFNNYYDWDNSTITNLSKQIKRPLYNKHPKELGFDEDTIALFYFFEQNKTYHNLFQKAFPNVKKPISCQNVEICLVEYVKNLKATRSKFDRYEAGEKSIFSSSEKRGMDLFFSSQLQCGSCHVPPLFTQNNLSKNADTVYANIGLYNIENKNKYPITDPGLSRVTNQTKDDGKFKIPSLRNVLLTAPYMHDGSVASIQEVIDLYAAGGRIIEEGIQKGDGRFHKNKHPFVRGFSISTEEKNDLIQFLSTLTDTSYLANPYFLNPFRIK